MTGADRSALLALLAGFTAWSLAFVLLYALQALGCEYGWSHHRVIMVCTYGAVLLAMACLAWVTPIWARGRGVLAVAAKWANRAALAASVLVFLPVTFTSACM